jgi:hypothetical protein
MTGGGEDGGGSAARKGGGIRGTFHTQQEINSICGTFRIVASVPGNRGFEGEEGGVGVDGGEPSAEPCTKKICGRLQYLLKE